MLDCKLIAVIEQQEDKAGNSATDEVGRSLGCLKSEHHRAQREAQREFTLLVLVVIEEFKIVEVAGDDRGHWDFELLILRPVCRGQTLTLKLERLVLVEVRLLELVNIHFGMF